MNELRDAVFSHQKLSKKGDVPLTIELTKEEWGDLNKELNKDVISLQSVPKESGQMIDNTVTYNINGSKLIITVKK